MERYVDNTENEFYKTADRTCYVDETKLLICLNRMIEAYSGKDGDKDAVESEHVNCVSVSRPYGFGKSTIAEMIDVYYSCAFDGDDELWGFDISEDPSFEKHHHQYHVIHIRMKSFLRDALRTTRDEAFIKEHGTADAEHVGQWSWSPAQMMEYLLLKDIREKYPDKTLFCTGVPDAMSKVTSATGKRFVVIIDDWDEVIRRKSWKKTMVDFYLWYLRHLFVRANLLECLALGYVTGTLPFSLKENSGDLFYCDSMTHTGMFTPFFGINKKDAQDLLRQADEEGEKGASLEKCAYLKGGYRLMWECDGETRKERLYSTSRIQRAFHNKPAGEYFYPYHRNLHKIVRWNFALKTIIRRILKGEEIKTDMVPLSAAINEIYDTESVLTLLVHVGYLGYKKGKVYIPDKECIHQLETLLRE